ncbi:NTPase-like protein [Mycoavidus cysteinexigens]|uniref:NTPase-like protein n=1 Tax=Mycoavidus cysteinexigens TaxID=1553431 RepID=A0A2Z6ETY3_9BURK|nr:NACHT domain-containing protein [Mycoavidus cysteinexigens]BBE08870.1 NTPase-like protein [Mycoavidus cysteinexigens]GAM52410.1 hypothetical protein EBME_0873 [bacterium endosymbiont of Mortierella elongata FMR23-6]GLR02195.1 hypothetical protein GCM10007934_20100 [Mycoavidus cysteinexigens]
MSPINPSQTQPPLSSYFSQFSLAFVNATRTYSTDRVDETAGSVMQVNYGLINIPTVGSHNEINVHYHSTVSDAQLLREILRPVQSVAIQSNNAPLAILGIEGLQRKYLESLEKDREIKDALAMYVAPECTSITNLQKRFSLEEKVRDFLASKEKKVLLLLGVAGSGKSTFNRYLARSLWEAYDKEANKSDQTPIPLFISLSSLKEPNSNLISEYLKKEGFTEKEIIDLKAKHRFIFVLDGYDEIEDRTRLFYIENELDEWQAKVIVTSRPEYLGDRYERQFHPKNQAYLLQTYQLAPFSDLTIEEYINKYKSTYPELEKSVAEHGGILERTEVKELIRNPFLLKLSLSELPALAEKYKDSSQRITRLALYEQFVESWFARSQDRLSVIRLTEEEQKAFYFLNKDFTKHGTKFSKDLAIEMYQAGLVRVTYSQQLSYDESNAAPQDWRDKFLSESNEKIKLLRFNSPLICRDDRYQFIHKSIQDYLVARVLWEELGAYDKIEHSSWLNTLNIVKDPAVLQFLADRAQQQSNLEIQLLSVVEQSKGEEGAQFERGAANAITILVKAGVQLINKDFNGIRVHGADLSYGVFDHTQFKDADLSEVNGTGAWLRRVNLNGANLVGLVLGERPTLEMAGPVNACCYSPDGRWFAAVDGSDIQLYETETLQWVHTYKGHVGYVTRIAFSPDGKWLASGSSGSNNTASIFYPGYEKWLEFANSNNTVNLWSVTGERGLVHTYAGHEKGVNSVAFSPDGQWLASGGNDDTVRLWLVSGDRSLAYTYAGHKSWVNSVVFSPDGRWIASGSEDQTVNLWEVCGARALVHTYTYAGLWEAVRCVAFSPDGRWLAYGNWDGTVKLWEASDTRALVHTYAQDEYGSVSCIAFSPDGQWIAAGNYSKKIKLWSVSGERALTYTYAGHKDEVINVVFSPDSQWIASASKDNTVRLWSVLGVRAFQYGHTGHASGANSIALSPDGQWLAAGDFDHTVKLWNVFGTKTLMHTYYTKHEGFVRSIVFSPDSQWIAFGVSDTVELWSTSGARALVHTYANDRGDVDSIAFSPDGQWIAFDGGWSVGLWDSSGTRVLERSYHCLYCDVHNIAFSPDGQWIAAGIYSEDGEMVKLWKVSEPHTVSHTYTHVGHIGSVQSIAFSPDSQWIAFGDDKTVKLWSVSGVRVLARTYSGHKEGINSVAFSPGGQWLASGSRDNTVRLWSVHTGDCQAILQSFVGSVSTVAWQILADGAVVLATGGDDQAVCLWRVLSNDLGMIGEIRLEWASRQDNLTATGALIENALNLSPQNKLLLRQRGAGRAETGENAISFFLQSPDEICTEEKL